MADNVAITAGSGTNIATDDIGGVQYQRVKVTLGADGAADLDLDSGQQAMANSLPVAIASNQSAVPVSLATAPALVAGTAVIGATQDAGPAAGAGVAAAPVHGDLTTATALTAAPTSGQKWVITDIFISTAAAAEVEIQEETSATVIFGPVFMPANGSAQFTPRGKLKLATADKKVMGHSSTADHVTVQVSVASEA